MKHCGLNRNKYASNQSLVERTISHSSHSIVRVLQTIDTAYRYDKSGRIGRGGRGEGVVEEAGLTRGENILIWFFDSQTATCGLAFDIRYCNRWWKQQPPSFTPVIFVWRWIFFTPSSVVILFSFSSSLRSFFCPSVALSGRFCAPRVGGGGPCEGKTATLLWFHITVDYLHFIIFPPFSNIYFRVFVYQCKK